MPELIHLPKPAGPGGVYMPGQLDARFHNVALGGTFDRLHDGHRALLSAAVATLAPGPGMISLGVTTQRLHEQKERADMILPYDTRVENAHNYIRTVCEIYNRQDIEVTVMPIETRFGYADMIKALDALIVSEETAGVADSLDEARKAHGFKPLAYAIVPLAKSPDGTPFSSTRLRE